MVRETSPYMSVLYYNIIVTVIRVSRCNAGGIIVHSTRSYSGIQHINVLLLAIPFETDTEDFIPISRFTPFFKGKRFQAFHRPHVNNVAIDRRQECDSSAIHRDLKRPTKPETVRELVVYHRHFKITCA